MGIINIVKVIVSLFVVLFYSSSSVVNSQLQVGFYGDSCSCAESVVKDEVTKAFMNNRRVAAGLIRMHFHDCFVRGCDGSILLDSTASNIAEKDSPVNNPSLHGFEVIDSAKARLESECRGVVSCTDILAFAARDSVEMSGGVGYDVPAGRRDGRVSIASETLTQLPSPTSNLNQLTQLFATKGLTQQQMVTLSGAHTIGQSHCSSFRDRLYNFNGSMSRDPSLNDRYAAELMQQCPQQGGTNSANNDLVVPMNPACHADTMDVSYYVGLMRNRGLFTSDQTLMTSPETANEVYGYATYQDSMLWKLNFADAMVKMGLIDVLTGYNGGEIRSNCRVINQYY
ncbi:hypothetical protein Dsin_001416 [Dipteronia sinensis]|uniref:Peroxidase n=1 Tax=Dipteronia sinensis TaxID=43782 RepID=A0AAE0B598_9ROSI|nr:hypothetical protein Dsin_001416 [Dipteronia sinensis]